MKIIGYRKFVLVLIVLAIVIVEACNRGVGCPSEF